MRAGSTLALGLCISVILPTEAISDHDLLSLYRRDTGASLGAGWVAEFGRHTPGYLLDGYKQTPTALAPGTYQYTFYLQRGPGHLGGLFSGANDAVRLEVLDDTTHERIAAASFQENDFTRPWSRTPAKSVMFSTWGREGHRFVPRVYWPGLVSMRLQRVTLEALDPWSEAELEAKAKRMETLMSARFLDRGFVVMRDAMGAPADINDAALWTGIYAASEAWRFQATRDPRARMRMETSLWALHRLHQAASPDTLVRFVDADGHVSPQAASKDTYTGFFFAVGQCWPDVQNPRLRRALQEDVDALAGGFIDHDLYFRPAHGKALDLNPYFPDDILRDLVRELHDDPGLRRSIVLAFKVVRRYFHLMRQRPPTSFAGIERAVHDDDAEALNRLLIPFLNDALTALRLMDVNVARSAGPAERLGLHDAPYQRVHDLLRVLLQRFNRPAPAIQSVQDLKVLPSQALVALHILKVAGAVMPPGNRFERYYADNLWTGKALLRTVMDWTQWDELFAASLFGESRAARVGGSSLPYLALWDLCTLDTNSAHRQDYLELMARHRLFMHNDLNAMTDMMAGRLGLNPDPRGVAFWVLHRYPEERRGFGDAYWSAHGHDRAAAFGGWDNGYARDPIPPNFRPRDAFLWQRDSHSLRGDMAGWEYAPVDYLMVWWMSQSAKRAAVSENR